MTMTKEEIKAALEREKQERKHHLEQKSKKQKGFVLYGYHVAAGLFIVITLLVIMMLVHDPKSPSSNEVDSRVEWERTKQTADDFFKMDSKKGYVDRILDSKE